MARDSSYRTASFTNSYVRSGGKITAIGSTFGQLTRIPYADSIGVARQFQIGARLAFQGRGSGLRIPVCVQNNALRIRTPKRGGRRKEGTILSREISSDRDQRWRLGANAVWQSPWFGVTTAGAIRFATGLPYTPRSNFDFNNDGQSGTDRPTLGCTPVGSSFDCTNGTHLGRNSFRQPSICALDFRLQKAFRIGPGDFGLAVDSFNCTNTGNKFVSQTTYGRIPSSTNPTETPQAGFGNANNPGTPRTLQVSARYEF